MNVFFLNVGRRCELVESFARVLPAVSPGLIWGSDPNPLAPALAVVDRRVELPTTFESVEFLDQLSDFLVKENIDLVVPTIDPDLVRLDQWRNVLKERAACARLLLSPTSVIQVARDKRLSRDAFVKLGAEVPESIDPKAKDLPFPLFIKPATGSASIGAVRVDSETDMYKHLVTTIEPMVERFVTGDETTVDVLLDLKGRPVCAVPRRRIQVRGGEVIRSIVERSTALESLAMTIAKGLGCIGPVTLQFRNPSPGRWVAMELNARMGGGLPLTIKAGADWPRWILQMVAGQELVVEPTTIRDGMVMTRTDRSFFLSPPHLVAPNGLVDPLPRVIVFDLDDTLYPEADFVQSGHRVIAEQVWKDFNIDIEPELRRRFSAGQRGDLMSTVLSDLRMINVPKDYVGKVLVPLYRNHMPKIQPYVETVPVLTELRMRGHRLALLTDGWSGVQRRKLNALGLADLFDEIIFTDELGQDAWKPSTKGFERILKAFDVRGEEAMYVSDNPYKDFLATQQLGMHSVRIVRPCTEYGEVVAPSIKHKPQRTIQQLRELLVAKIF